MDTIYRTLLADHKALRRNAKQFKQAADCLVNALESQLKHNPGSRGHVKASERVEKAIARYVVCAAALDGLMPW